MEDYDLSSQPNDAYFKQVFSQPEQAAAFFQNHLPANIADHIDWSTLTLQPTNFVKSSLQQTHSDLLFSTQASGRKLLLYLLFEHQTSVDATMPLRLLAYVLEILLAHERQHGLPLPPVLPFVLHQGPERWTASTCFEDLVEAPEELAADLSPFLPKFTHALLDLSQFDPAREENHAQMRMVLQLMKLARGRRLLEFFEWLKTQDVDPMPITLLRLSLMYALHADSRLDVKEIYHTLQDNPALKEQTMSIAEKLIAEGEARGEARGKALGEAQGEKVGEARGKLKVLRELMNLPPLSSAEMEAMTLEELRVRFQSLQEQYQAQFKTR